MGKFISENKIIIILVFLASFAYQMSNGFYLDKETRYEQAIETMNNGITTHQKQIIIPNEFTKKDFYGNNEFEEVLGNNNYKKISFDKQNTVFEIQE